MKKVICAAAAFAMVAGVATVASAEVKLSGDARSRIVYKDPGVKEANDYLDSRVRLKIDAKTEGGGYMKARVRFLDGSWGQGFEYSPLAKGDKNVWSDYAFMGFKKGNIDVAGGKMPIGFSQWLVDDERADRFRVRYNIAKGCFVALTYDKKVYGDDIVKSTAFTVPTADGGVAVIPGYNVGGLGGDKDVWGITWKGMFGEGMGAKARLAYVDDGATGKDMSGLLGSVQLSMGFGGNNIVLEQSYKEGDIYGTDDQYGGYVEWNSTFGTITPAVTLGYTADGFSADETFGWIMIGGDESITMINRVGLGGDTASFRGLAGDTLFAGVSSKFQLSEDFAVEGNLAFLDIDGGSLYGENPIEISGQAKYDISKGVAFTAKAGWLGNDGDIGDDAFGAYGKMEVKF
ncbi:MAG: hypothetical protein ABFR63_01800 [Thermodesulfobacteriota bacterium]